MNILIVNPQISLEHDYIDYPCFANLGMLQHAAIIGKHGHTVKAADAFATGCTSAHLRTDGGISAGLDIVSLLTPHKPRSFDATVVCLSVFHKPYKRNSSTKSTFQAIKEFFPKTPLIAADAYFGGTHYVGYDPSDFFTNYPEVDYLVRGESETTLLELLNSISHNKAPSRALTGSGANTDLDNLPIPAWSLIDMPSYWNFIAELHETASRTEDFLDCSRILPLVTSRGCLFDCSFCCRIVGGQRIPYRAHTTDYLRSYLTLMKERYDIQGVAVLDGLANGPGFKQRLGLFESLSLRTFFLNGLRADMLTKSHIGKLARISPSLTISAESAVARVRNNILNKKLKLDSIEKTAEHCCKSLLPLKIHYMVGIPGESPSEINQTLEHACSMLERYGAQPLMQICTPIPGTRLHEKHCPNAPSSDPSIVMNSGSFDPSNHTMPIHNAHAHFMFAALRSYQLRLSCERTERIIINLTYHCGNRCEFCAVAGRPLRHAGKRRCIFLLEKYRRMGAHGVDFDGGEPTLHPRLFEIIWAARELGYQSISVSTNGRSCSDRSFSSRLLLSGINNILVTLYGHNAEIHERCTRTPGSFEETLSGIRNILRLKPERVSFTVNTVASRHNYLYFGDMMDLLASLGAKRLNIQFITPFGGARKEHCPPLEETCERISHFMNHFSGTLDVRIINLPPCVMKEQETAVLADAGKFSRVMAFINEPPQNLGRYLSSGRKRGQRCQACPYRIICGGFYMFPGSAASSNHKTES
jgi:MoaA/NifB/PqqE/SkfB family radical SAM enzyme